MADTQRLGQPTVVVESDLPAVVADKYKVIRLLGAGGMATVYLVEANLGSAKSELVMKVPNPGCSAEDIEQFIAEAHALFLSVSSPHVIKPIGGVERLPDGRPVLLMEYHTGGTLHEFMGQQRKNGESRLDVGLAVRFARQVAMGLAAAHDKGLVHHDLKPENIFVDAENEVEISSKKVPTIKLGDFGLATRIGSRGIDGGTLEYLSPEQANRGGKLATASSDLFALGIILYELLSGGRPWPVIDAATVSPERVGVKIPPNATEAERASLRHTAWTLAVLKQRETVDAAPLDAPFDAQDDASMRAIDGRLAEIVARLLARDSSKRFASAKQVDSALETFLAQYEGRNERTAIARVADLTPDEPSSRSTSTIDTLRVLPSRPRRNLVAWGVAALLVGVVGTWLLLQAFVEPTVVLPVAVEPAPAEKVVAPTTMPVAEHPDEDLAAVALPQPPAAQVQTPVAPSVVTKTRLTVSRDAPCEFDNRLRDYARVERENLHQIANHSTPQYRRAEEQLDQGLVDHDCHRVNAGLEQLRRLAGVPFEE